MYDKAKSCVSCGNQQSEYFQSNVGVRQGENLSTLLLAFTIDVYLRLFILLYADDTVVLAENKEQLQVGIYAMKDFCEHNSLQLMSIRQKL